VQDTRSFKCVEIFKTAELRFEQLRAGVADVAGAGGKALRRI
jgi:hypothetical protein